jgi:hypothetical protein
MKAPQIFFRAKKNSNYATRFRRPPFSHQTRGSSGRFSICDNSFLISANRLARISTADWSIWLSVLRAADFAFMFRKSVIS